MLQRHLFDAVCDVEMNSRSPIMSEFHYVQIKTVANHLSKCTFKPQQLDTIDVPFSCLSLFFYNSVVFVKSLDSRRTNIRRRYVIFVGSINIKIYTIMKRFKVLPAKLITALNQYVCSKSSSTKSLN